jgi:hypothetical protein
MSRSYTPLLSPPSAYMACRGTKFDFKFLEFRTFHSRRRRLDVLFLTNIFKGKINCRSNFDTVHCVRLLCITARVFCSLCLYCFIVLNAYFAPVAVDIAS